MYFFFPRGTIRLFFGCSLQIINSPVLFVTYDIPEKCLMNLARQKAHCHIPRHFTWDLHLLLTLDRPRVGEDIQSFSFLERGRWKLTLFSVNRIEVSNFALIFCTYIS